MVRVQSDSPYRKTPSCCVPYFCFKVLFIADLFVFCERKIFFSIRVCTQRIKAHALRRSLSKVSYFRMVTHSKSHIHPWHFVIIVWIRKTGNRTSYTNPQWADKRERVTFSLFPLSLSFSFSRCPALIDVLLIMLVLHVLSLLSLAEPRIKVFSRRYLRALIFTIRCV